MIGWIKLYRKILDNPLWLSEPFTRAQAWIDLLLLANHKDSFFYVRGNRITVKRGEVGMSIRNLAERWQWSRAKVNRFINDLESEHQIEPQKNNITTLLSICNYDDYQIEEPQDEPQTEPQKSHRKATEKPQTLHKQEDKNDKNNNITPTPPKGGGINSKAKEIFENHFRETYSNDYYWSAKDAGAMTQLIKKLKFSREQKKLPIDDVSVLDALRVFLSSINDGWIYENFSVTNIASKYNEIVSSIKRKRSSMVLTDNSSDKYKNNESW